MKRLSIIVVSILALILSVQVLAQDDGEGLADDANACYEGGSLEGKCGNSDLDRDGTVEEWEIDRMYTCGWYLIRLENGVISRQQFPNYCEFLLQILEGAGSSGPVCYTNGEISFLYGGPPNQYGNITYFGSTNCTGEYYVPFTEGLIVAPSLPAAQSICTGLGGYVGSSYSAQGYNTPSNYWRCGEPV